MLETATCFLTELRDEKKSEQSKPKEPAEQAEPTEQTEPTEQAESTEQTEATEQTELDKKVVTHVIGISLQTPCSISDSLVCRSVHIAPSQRRGLRLVLWMKSLLLLRLCLRLVKLRTDRRATRRQKCQTNEGFTCQATHSIVLACSGCNSLCCFLAVTQILVDSSQDESKLVINKTERCVEKHGKPSQDLLRTGNYALNGSSCEMDRLDALEENVAGSICVSVSDRPTMSAVKRLRDPNVVQLTTATTGLRRVPLVWLQQHASSLCAFVSQPPPEACMGQREEDSLGFGSQPNCLLLCDCVHVEGRHDDGTVVVRQPGTQLVMKLVLEIAHAAVDPHPRPSHLPSSASVTGQL